MLKSYTHFREETNFYHNCDHWNFIRFLEGKVTRISSLQRRSLVKSSIDAYDLSTARRLMLAIPFRGYSGINE